MFASLVTDEQTGAWIDEQADMM